MRAVVSFPAFALSVKLEAPMANAKPEMAKALRTFFFIFLSL